MKTQTFYTGLAMLVFAFSGCATPKQAESRKIASEASRDPLSRIFESYGVSPSSAIELKSEKLKILNPSLARDHRTLVPLIQTSETPTQIEVTLRCTKQKQVCLDSEFVPTGGYGYVGSNGSGGGMSFSLVCREYGYREVYHRRPAVLHFEESSKPKAGEKNYYLLQCDDSQGANRVRLHPVYSDEAPYCSGAANKVTTNIKKRFLVKNKTVFAVYNDGKDPCAKNESEIKEEE